MPKSQILLLMTCLNLRIKLIKTVIHLILFKNLKMKISQNRYISHIRARRHRHITRVHKV